MAGFPGMSSGGLDIMSLLQSIIGANSVSPRVDLPPPVPGATPQLPPQTTVPGAQTLPKPQPRPGDLLGMLMGPSISPSQAGVTYSPSQGPGAAVTDAVVPVAAKMPSAMDALRAPTANAGPQVSQAPAPPAPRSIAAGQLQALLGGQNPLAQSRAINLPLLSKLLGGR